MTIIENCRRDLAIANRIMAREEVVDHLGHVSARHPDRPDRFLLSQSRSPELVTPGDIKEYDLAGSPIEEAPHPMYVERFIHAAIYRARPDVNSVAHNHAYDLLPFTIASDVKLRAVVHPAYAIGTEAPVWDFRDKFPTATPLVLDMAQGDDLAAILGNHSVALMRNHGCVVALDSIVSTIYACVYVKVNARIQSEATRFGGDVSYLSAVELEAIGALYNNAPHTVDRAWEYWVRRADLSGI
ncbi:class II aldolase/adducin family protein [Blastococcus brunescens]|uniref:Class II aldolase/adducin family protein n=1 Tax=Blastococcus brunescens TaxID=1564165 RepID=A0ABZ1AYG2_9ACTN|nr:class II aldolase/adducin family protein [Blastococcus sp. BMG 8361]WRL63560.1 class II aldolase/adducin family protein [Blastococcus sp. BMG 8361]